MIFINITQNYSSESSSDINTSVSVLVETSGLVFWLQFSYNHHFWTDISGKHAGRLGFGFFSCLCCTSLDFKDKSALKCLPLVSFCIYSLQCLQVLRASSPKPEEHSWTSLNAFKCFPGRDGADAASLHYLVAVVQFGHGGRPLA